MLKQIGFTGTRTEWESAVKKEHPTAKISAAGSGRFFATVGSIDVGMFSTIQGGGWIK